MVSMTENKKKTRLKKYIRQTRDGQMMGAYYIQRV